MQIALNILITASALALIAMGINLAMMVTRQIPVSLAAVTTVASYSFFDLFQQGINIWLSGACTLFIAAFLGVLFDFFEQWILGSREESRGWRSVAVGLGLFTIIQAFSGLVWGEAGQSFTIDREVFEIAGARLTTVHVSTISGALVALAITVWFIYFTHYGLQIRALRSNPTLCEVFGINISQLRGISLMMAAMLSSLGIQFLVLDTGLTLSSGFNFFLAGLTASILGGAGTVAGAIFGALLITVVRNVTAYTMGVIWMEPISFIILIAVLIARPLGLIGYRLRKIEI